MLGSLDIGRLMTCNLLSESREDFRVFPILLGIGLELDFEIAYVPLQDQLLAGTDHFSSPRWQHSSRSTLQVGP